MHPINIVICLPILLLTLPTTITCASEDLPRPYDLPQQIEHYPSHEALVKRKDEISETLQQGPPAVVRKMSFDPGEMFFLHYWSFNEGCPTTTTDDKANSSLWSKFEPAVPLHASHQSYTPRLLERYVRLPVPAVGLFSKRDFVCPSNTNACTSINRPNVCCPSGSTCQIVQDTGLGDVGCCNAGSTCAGSLSQCQSGYTACPNNPGGGCCLPGFQCYQEGCIQVSTTVIVATPSPTSTSRSTVIETTTVIVTPTSPTTSSEPVSPSSSSSSTSSSPLSSADPTTIISTTTITSSPMSTASIAPPVRGTSSSPSSLSLSSYSGCPTGFYACSAYNPGGCCQVGRDCSSTSCPAKSGVTVVAGSATIVAPSGSSVSQGFLTGACATGWSTCATGAGGGCCPSGYSCGTAACTATVSGQTATQGKIAPNGVNRVAVERGLHGLWVGTMVLGLAMVV